MPDKTHQSDLMSRGDAVIAAVASCVGDCLLVVDRGGRVIFANQASCEFLGIKPEPLTAEAALQHVEDRLHLLRFVDDQGEACTWMKGPLSWALSGTQPESRELREVGVQPERHLRLRTSPVVDAGGGLNGAVLAFHDLSALRRAQERLERAVEIERRRSSQLRSLNHLAVAVNSETEPGRILDEVLGGALRLTRAAVGAAYLPSPTGLRLEAFVTASDPGEDRHRYAPGRIDLKEVAQRSIDVRRILRMAEEMDRSGGRFLGYLGVPLIAREGGILACIVLAGSPDPFGFTAEDEVVVTTLAAHAGVALENLQRLAGEHDIALYLQRAMLPGDIRVPGLRVDHVYQSATDAALVGGDFYDVIPVSGDRVAVVVGDVCGKGLSAATFMSFVRHTLRAQAAMDLSPGPWLDSVNVALASDPETGSFVTVALAVIDTTSGAAELALAGHPSPLIATPSGVIQPHGVPGLPLGVNVGVRYGTTSFRLEPGHTLCMYTDGLYEARRGDVFFGEAGLIRAVEECSQGALDGSAERLVAQARKFAGGRLADDCVVMLVRISEESSSTRPRRASRQARAVH